MAIKKTTTVILVAEPEGPINSITFDHDESVDVETAMRLVVQTFLKSDDAKRCLDHTDGNFNWGDALIHITDAEWTYEGLFPTLTDTILSLDHDESLIE